MKYSNSTKCTFIGSTHAIFDFNIWENFKTLICDGNLIIDKQLNCNVEICMRVQNAEVPNDEIQKAIEHCQDRAKFIYKKN